MGAETNTEVFKLQRQINGFKVLIYNETRSHYGETRMTPELLRLFDGEFKVYVSGFVSDLGQLEIQEIVPNQKW